MMFATVTPAVADHSFTMFNIKKGWLWRVPSLNSSGPILKIAIHPLNDGERAAA